MTPSSWSRRNRRRDCREGLPWSWCLEWPDAFVERCTAPELLAKGFHHVHVNIHGTWASPEGMEVLEAFYAMLVKLGFHRKAMLMGLSMSGLYSFRFAMENPDKIAVIYGDAPVCDLKEYPADHRKPVYDAYGFKSADDPRIPVLNPMEHLDILVRAHLNKAIRPDSPDCINAFKNYLRSCAELMKEAGVPESER